MTPPEEDERAIAYPRSRTCCGPKFTSLACDFQLRSAGMQAFSHPLAQMTHRSGLMPAITLECADG